MLNISHAQLTGSSKLSSSGIEELFVYPNPVENGKIYITTKNNLPKTIKVYDVLGKQVMLSTTQNKALDISKLPPGIYILKIKENKLSATRKLVVR